MPQAANEVVAKIEAGGGKALAVKCDVRSEVEILDLFDAADGLGRLAALVNSAGIVDVTARVDQMSADAHAADDGHQRRRQHAVRARGREADVDAAGGKGGVIVNVSSAQPCLDRPDSMSTTPPRRARSTRSPSASAAR